MDSKTPKINKPYTCLKEKITFSSQHLRNKWCKQLLYKLNIIHNGFKQVHGSIRLDNLKVDQNENLILTYASESSSVDVGKGMKFKAPELIHCNKKSLTGDVWATGICIYYMTNLNFPWELAERSDERYCLWADEGILSTSKNNSYAQIIQQMVCVESKMRPSIENILKSTCEYKLDSDILSKQDVLILFMNVLISIQKFLCYFISYFINVSKTSLNSLAVYKLQKKTKQ